MVAAVAAAFLNLSRGHSVAVAVAGVGVAADLLVALEAQAVPPPLRLEVMVV